MNTRRKRSDAVEILYRRYVGDDPARKAAIEAARKARLDPDKVDAFLAARFSKSQVSAIKLAHLADEGRPIETLWDVNVGATAYARSIPFQADRLEVERKAGKVLAMAV